MNAWVNHFKHLSTSKASGSLTLTNLRSVISSYRRASFDNEDLILDCDVTIEEIQGCIRSMKKGKACGPDRILSEHVIYGGDYLELWLKKIFNEIIRLEGIPPSFKDTIIIPIYKGKGRDPLLTKNYRGISLSSVIGKLFERVLLLRIQPILEEKGIPHHTQTAYQAGLSCNDATEVVQEVIRSYIDGGATVFQCFYDLEKAFDSIEHNVLLNHLYRAGINGKAWRIIGAFYDDATASVRLGLNYSEAFHLGRGVKQGSVLSPLLFLLVIDSLLEELESTGLGVSIHGHYLGSLGHADDLRGVAPNLDILEQQASIVRQFTVDNGLRLNEDKLELQEFSIRRPQPSTMSIGETTIASASSSTCLGVKWSHDLSPTESINHNIAKARQAFFAHRANGIAYGEQNPLSSSELFEVCVLPVCLYGSENWILTEPMISSLDQFQGELGKKILNLPKHHSNLIPLVALQWPTMRLRILHRKISFLWRLLHPKKVSISVEVFNCLREKDSEPLVIQQCKFLEQVYKTNLTEVILQQEKNFENHLTLRAVKDKLQAADRDYIWSLVSSRENLAALSRDISWMRLWDEAREQGIRGARAIATVLRVITIPVFTDDFACPVCGHKYGRSNLPADHITKVHLGCELKHLLHLLTTPCEETFEKALSLRTILHTTL